MSRRLGFVLSVLMAVFCIETAGRPAGGQEQKKSPTTQSPNQELLTAVQTHDAAKSRALLEHGADPNAKDKNGTSAFLHSVSSKDRDLIALMIAKGANVNELDGDGDSALLRATFAGDVDVIQMLLEHGAAPESHSNTGATALTLAASSGRLPIVAALLEAGAGVDVKGQYDDTALLISARKGDANMVSALLEKGANPDSQSNVGDTAVMEVARNGNRQVGGLLLAKGASIKGANHEGKTALMFAAQSSSLDLVRKIAAAGADLNARDVAGKTALMYARGSNAAEIARLLISKGADVNAADRYGCTALMRAAMGSDTRLVRALLAAGAASTARDAMGRTALTRARAIGASEIVKLLGDHPDSGSLAAYSRSDYLHDAVQTTLPLLQSTAATFKKASQGACFSCHHQSLPAFTISVARSHGFHIDDGLAREQSAFVLGFFSQARAAAIKGMTGDASAARNEVGQVFPGQASHVGYGVLGLEADAQKPNTSTEAVALFLTRIQEKDGRWKSACTVRDPAEKSDFTETALAVKALRDFASKDHDKQTGPALEAAKAWLTKTAPHNTEDRTFRLLGLVWAGADTHDKVVQDAVRTLLAGQRADGGWGHIPAIKSDSYATGEALAALNLAGGLPIESAAYQRGVDFLLRTREEDGTWYVKSRTVPFQPYIETGFPYGKDQFISCTATCWATAALALAAPMPQRTASR